MARPPGLPRSVQKPTFARRPSRGGAQRLGLFRPLNRLARPDAVGIRNGRPTVRAGPPRTLDVGTGGGEVIGRLMPVLGRTTVVDHQHGMATAAHARLSPRASVVVAEGRDLPFRDARFGLVLDRHAHVSLAEFARVLVPGGLLIIQQVGGHNLQSLFDALGWGTNADQWGEEWSRTQRLDALVSTAPGLGLEVIRADDYQVDYAIGDLGSLLVPEILALPPAVRPWYPRRWRQPSA